MKKFSVEESVRYSMHLLSHLEMESINKKKCYFEKSLSKRLENESTSGGNGTNHGDGSVDGSSGEGLSETSGVGGGRGRGSGRRGGRAAGSRGRGGPSDDTGCAGEGLVTALLL